MKTEIAFLFLLHVHISLGQTKTYSDYTLFRTTPFSNADLDFIKKLGAIIKIDFWRQPGEVNMTVDMMIGPEDKKTFQKLMDKHHIMYDIAIENVQRAFDEQTVKNYTRRKMETFDWEHYFRLDDIYAWLRDMVQQRPDEIEIINIGRTEEHRPILALHVVLNGSKNRSTVIIEGGIHAREWIAPAFVTYMINEIVNSDKLANPQLRNIALTYEWYFIPVLNPDGYEYSHTHDRMWRKNRAYGIGVDINRNFDVAFTESKNNPISESYRGARPFSEKESYALSKLASSKASRMEYYVAFHSYGQVILIPHTHSNKHFYNYKEVKNMLDEACNAIATRFRTMYHAGLLYETLGGMIQGTSKETNLAYFHIYVFGYYASGVSISWVKAKFLTPYVALFELRDTGHYGFALPVNKIQPTCQETMDGLLSFLKPRTKKFEKPVAGNNPDYLTPSPDTLYQPLSPQNGQRVKYLNPFVFMIFFVILYCDLID